MHAGRCSLVLVAALAVMWPAAAQDVLFVSDRYDPRGIRQNEIYRHVSGSEIRVTDTPVWAEHDPVPSPDGDLIAAAATNFIFPVTRYDDVWSWRYVVYDERGRTVDAWPIDGSTGMFRPAGGYRIAWLPDGKSFLAIAYDDEADWQIVRYVLDSRRTIGLGPGYEIEMHPDGERFATSHNGIIFLVEIATGSRSIVAGGRPLGWSEDGTELFFEQGSTLYHATPEDPDRRRAIGTDGPYVALQHAPDGERFAVASVAGESSSVTFYDRRNRRLERWTTAAAAISLAWLDGRWLVVELVDATAGIRLELVSVDGGTRPFVDSAGDDMSPRVVH